jgi:DNA-binding transcriptional ArsR family regulator
MKEKEGLERIFLREKPTQALLAVGEMNPAYAAIVAKRIDSTFPHTSSILSLLEEHGLVKARPQGRVRYLELTERGKKTARALKDLSDLLQEPDAKWKMMERLKQIVALEAENGSSNASSLRLGPLRRDLARMKEVGDEELAKAAGELDGIIVHALRT